MEYTAQPQVHTAEGGVYLWLCNKHTNSTQPCIGYINMFVWYKALIDHKTILHYVYSGNILRELTSTNWWENRISQRKLSWIACSYYLLSIVPSNILRENFRGQVQNIEIHEHFLPRKFPAIRYYVDVPPGNVIVHKQCFHLSQSQV